MSRVRLFWVAMVLCAGLLTACAPREVKPPPQTGHVIARFSHGQPAIDVAYTVGRLDGQLQIAGNIVNTYLSDLDNFRIDLSVIGADKKVVFKDSTPVFDIPELSSHTFAFRVPMLHGPYKFSFRYEYDYYDFAETGRRGRFMRADTNEWSYFEDQVTLP